MTNRRMISKGRMSGYGVDNGSHYKRYDRASLLGTGGGGGHSPPSNSSGYGYSDPHISTLYPGSSSVDSFEVALSQAANNNVTPDGRFIPQHSPRGSPPVEGEISPSDGALQFVPSYEESTQTDHAPQNHYSRQHNRSYLQKQPPQQQQHNFNNDITWDAIIEDNDSPYERKAKSMVGQGSNHFSSALSAASFNKSVASYKMERERGEEAAESLVSGVSGPRKGSRIARLASLFSSRAVIKAGNNSTPSTAGTSPASSHSSNSPRYSATIPAKGPPSPSQSSSSAGYLGWPGTQDKRGDTIAIQSDDSSVGATPRVLRFDDPAQGQGGPRHEEDRKWKESSAALHDLPSGAPSPVMPRPSANRVTPRELLERDNSTCYSGDSQEEQNSADYHLFAAVSDAKAAAASPLVHSKKGAGATAMDRLTDSQIHPSRQRSPGRANFANSQNQPSGQRSPGRANFANSQNHPIRQRSPGRANFASRNSNLATVADIRESTQNPADKHLNTAVAQPRVRGRLSTRVDMFTRPTDVNSRPSPKIVTPKSTTDTEMIHGKQLLFDSGSNQFKDPGLHLDMDDGATQSSSSGAGASKSSSAFFNESEVRNMTMRAVDTSRARANKRLVASSVMRPKLDEPQPPTEDALAINNQLSPPHRSFSNSRGYLGLLDKTKDVPNLMDGTDSESVMSSRTNSHNSSAVRPYESSPPAYRHNPSLQTHKEAGALPSTDAESDVFDEISKYSLSDKNSDFDNLQNVTSGETHSSNAVRMKVNDNTFDSSFCSSGNDISNDSGKGVKLVLLGGGLTTIQTTQEDFSNRQTADDFDDNLTNSDVDQYGFCRIPGFNEMASAGKKSTDSSIHRIESNITDDVLSESFERGNSRSHESDYFGNNTSLDSGVNSSGVDSSSYGDDESAFFSDFYEGYGWNLPGDLSQYYVQPSQVKKLVRKYRKLCKNTGVGLSHEELENHEDDKKAFALFEMRSRIMEKDIERGLERRGGTVPVDDLVLTPYNRTGLRVRDAVIVSKAWRDGASPMDVVNTSLLTRRDENTFFIKRPIRSGGQSASWNDFRAYWWEQVTWVDDTDFMLYKCPSLGPRHMRGFEMFTIGDCQSILLKLANERCMELRTELNDATARQIEAEEMMKEEGDVFDGMMTEAEMTYLTSMEQVKSISKKLVAAERSFTLVRDRIESLVARYESLLIKIENESCAASSVITYESSYYSDAYSDHSMEEDREKKLWARRAQRAEVRAELTAREALLTKKGASHIHNIDKHNKDLEELQERLTQLQSEPSTALSRDKQHSVVLAKAIAAKQRFDVQNSSTENKSTATNQNKINDVKQRFRERMAAKIRRNDGEPSETGGYTPSQTRSNLQSSHLQQPTTEKTRSSRNHVSHEQQKLFRSAGEEMFQHLGFYERSLKAVEDSRR